MTTSTKMVATRDVNEGDVLLVHQNGCTVDGPTGCDCSPWFLTVASRHRPTNGIATFRDADGRESVASYDGRVEVVV